MMAASIDQAHRLREMVESLHLELPGLTMPEPSLSASVVVDDTLEDELLSPFPLFPEEEILGGTKPSSSVLPHVRTVAVTSGKGGVGKSNIVSNLAIALSRRGRKILVVDADLSLANIHVLLGLQPRYNLAHVISGQKRLAEIVLEGPSGIKVIPASSGMAELAMLRERELEGLIEQFSGFMPEMDLVLIDTAAGLSDSVLSFVHSAGEVILVTTPEPTAYLDAYQMLKNIHTFDSGKLVHLLVNQASSEKEGHRTTTFMIEMAQKFLGYQLSSLGAVLRDPDVPVAIRNQRAFLEEVPHGIASRGIQALATRILNSQKNDQGLDQDVSSLWKRVASYLKRESR
jgi:flagellar biosynthesis protein FlhG